MRFAVQYSETMHLSLSPYRNEISFPIEMKFQSYSTKNEIERVSPTVELLVLGFFVPRDFSQRFLKSVPYV